MSQRINCQRISSTNIGVELQDHLSLFFFSFWRMRPSSKDSQITPTSFKTNCLSQKRWPAKYWSLERIFYSEVPSQVLFRMLFLFVIFSKFLFVTIALLIHPCFQVEFLPLFLTEVGTELERGDPPRHSYAHHPPLPHVVRVLRKYIFKHPVLKYTASTIFCASLMTHPPLNSWMG